MLSRLELTIELLHAVPEAALATHATALPGFPFASVVSFVADERHRPVFLISRLAEHTRNLATDARAGLVMAMRMGEGEIARVTLLGEARPIEANPLLTNRYLRHHPHAEYFLQLGDFAFYRLDPLRILAVGGFAQAGWIEGARLLDAPAMTLEEEAALLERHADELPSGWRLVGADFYGVNVLREGQLSRIRFPTGAVTREAWLPTLRRALRTAAADDLARL